MSIINPVSNTPKIRPIKFDFGRDAENLNKSFKSVFGGLKNSQENIKKINDTLEKRVVSRRSKFAKLFEADRVQRTFNARKQREDEIEATKIPPPNTMESITNAASAAGGGFLGRLMKVIGFTLVGALLKYIPPLVGYAEEFIARLGEFGRIIGSFTNNTIEIFRSTLGLLNSIKENILRLDFFDSEKRVKNSFDELVKNIEDLSGDFQDTVDLFTTDITKEIDGVTVGSYSGKEIPPVGGYEQEEPTLGESGGSGGNFGTKEQRALLDAISFAEGTTGGYGIIYGGANVPELAKGELTVKQVYDMMMSGKLNGRNVGYKSGSRATGRYQFMPDTLSDIVKSGAISWNEKFTPEAQDRAILARIASFRGVTPELLKREGLSAKVSNMLAPEFASLPTYSGASFWGQPVKSLSDIQKNYQQSLQKQQVQTPSAGTAKASRTLTPLSGTSGTAGGAGRRLSTPLSPFLPGTGATITSGKGWRTSTNSYHRGYDVGAATGTPVYSYFPGVVTRVLINGQGDGGYGNAIEWKDDIYGQTHFYGHLSKPPSLSVGAKFQANSLLGYVGGTGYGLPNKYDPHLHWEIGPRGSEQDPGEWLRSVAAKPSQAQMAAAPSQPQGQQTAQQITPERKPKDVVANVPQPVAKPQPSQGAAAPSGGQGKPPSIGDMLNNFMKQKLLLDTSFL
jgi:lysozyme